jgi:hypothetical protein
MERGDGDRRAQIAPEEHADRLPRAADNPIYRLATGLDRLAKLRFPVHLTETTKLYFDRRAGIESGQLQSDMRAILRVAPDPAALERLSSVESTGIASQWPPYLK